MKNTCFSYLYRDASNFKKWNHIVFANSKGLPIHFIFDQITRAMLGGLFIADQIRLPEQFIYNSEPLNPDDHCFHEFSKIEETDTEPNDPFHRTIEDFINELLRAQEEGWQVFDPWERCYERQLSGLKRKNEISQGLSRNSDSPDR